MGLVNMAVVGSFGDGMRGVALVRCCRRVYDHRVVHSGGEKRAHVPRPVLFEGKRWGGFIF